MLDDSVNQTSRTEAQNTVTAVNQNPSKDLISVRDIYLILRKGLPLIVIVSFLVAILTFVYFSLKKDIYEAVATTVVSPSGLDIRNANGISFSPQISPSFETYKSLAYSDPVILNVLDTVGQDFPNLDISVQAFKRRSDVEKIYGPLNNRPDTADRVALALSQKFRHETPTISVALTNAWTEKTIETVQETLSASLNSIDSLTKNSFESARKNLEESQEALKQAATRGALDVLDLQVLSAGQHIADQKVRLSEAKTELEVARQLQTILLGQPSNVVPEESRALLETQLASVKADVEQAFSELNQFQKSYDLIALEARNLFLSIQLAEFEQLLSVARASSTGQARANAVSTIREDMLQNALLDSANNTRTDALNLEDDLLASEQINNSGQIATEVDSRPLETLSEIRNYISYRYLTDASDTYTVDQLEKTVLTMKEEIEVISSEYGPLKLQESKLRSAYDLAQNRLSQVLLQRNQLASENEGVLLSLEAEVLGLAQQMQVNEQDLSSLQAQRAEVQQEVGTLMIEVEAAADVYGEIGGLEPTIAYLTQLTPLSAQVVNLASTSLEPIGTGRALPTVLAFLLTAIIMTVLVFFREAIKL